jgi:hypothetical protein
MKVVDPVAAIMVPAVGVGAARVGDTWLEKGHTHNDREHAGESGRHRVVAFMVVSLRKRPIQEIR